jgi:uncharacterized protein
MGARGHPWQGIKAGRSGGPTLSEGTGWPGRMDDVDGAQAVRIARAAVDRAARDPGAGDPAVPFRSAPLSAGFDVSRGVFVTLSRWPSGALRGCIGYPLPIYPLRVAIPRVARSAALEDPRFPPVVPQELDSVRIEVSLLTVPEPLPGSGAEARLASVRAGRDGLIVERGGSSGLLLPQVAVEQGWDALELLEGTCVKAGLPKDAWRSRSTQIRRFEAELFDERSPGGPVERRGGASARERGKRT